MASPSTQGTSRVPAQADGRHERLASSEQVSEELTAESVTEEHTRVSAPAKRHPMRWMAWLIALVVAAVIAVPMALAGGVVMLADQTQQSSDADTDLCTLPDLGLGGAPADGGGTVSKFNAEQQTNARTIIAVAKALGLGERGAYIGIMTALQESSLKNLNYGDRDSLGLFQQRAPWGSANERTTPSIAATMFYTGGRGGQRGLIKVPNWQSLAPYQAAQAVQVSYDVSSAGANSYGRRAGDTQLLMDALFASTPAAAGSALPVPGGLGVDGNPATQLPGTETTSGNICDPNNGTVVGDPSTGGIDPKGGGASTANIPCAAMPGITDAGLDVGPGGVSLHLCTVAPGMKVDATASGAARSLLNAAAASGLQLSGGSYRSNASQIALRKAHCGSGWATAPASSCSPPTAQPGKSQHEWGLAIDFSNCSTRSTACYKWLAVNASKFGYINLPSEPWHWSTTGR